LRHPACGTNQSTNQPINQSTNQPINQSTNGACDIPLAGLTNQLTNQPNPENKKK